VSVLAQKVNASSELAAIPLKTADVKPMAAGSVPVTCTPWGALAVAAFAAGVIAEEAADN
jgi:hypothetical protein